MVQPRAVLMNFPRCGSGFSCCLPTSSSSWLRLILLYSYTRIGQPTVEYILYCKTPVESVHLTELARVRSMVIIHPKSRGSVCRVQAKLCYRRWARDRSDHARHNVSFTFLALCCCGTEYRHRDRVLLNQMKKVLQCSHFLLVLHT